MKIYKVVFYISIYIPLVFTPFTAFAKTEVLFKECDMRITAPDSFMGTISVRKIAGLLVDSFMPIHSHLSRLSKVCEIGTVDETKYTKDKTITVSFQHSLTDFRPRVYSWNEKHGAWEAHESTMNRASHTVNAEIPRIPQFIAVFADTRQEYSGIASWYSHKRYPLGSATNLFPIGTKLQVMNTKNNKNVFVSVTSTWTNKDRTRVIDLVKTAFEKIANPKTGLIPVTIKRISADDQT